MVSVVGQCLYFIYQLTHQKLASMDILIKHHLFQELRIKNQNKI